MKKQFLFRYILFYAVLLTAVFFFAFTADRTGFQLAGSGHQTSVFTDLDNSFFAAVENTVPQIFVRGATRSRNPFCQEGKNAILKKSSGAFRIYAGTRIGLLEFLNKHHQLVHLICTAPERAGPC